MPGGLNAKTIGYFALALLALFFVAMPHLRYEALSSSFFDLGIFATNFWNIAREPARAFVGHVQPLTLPYGMIYSVLPAQLGAHAIIAAQTAALIGSVAVIWRAFGAWAGAAMLLYFPLWTNALFDFHFDHLTVPILAAYFVACEKRRYLIAGLAALSLVLVKEPFALMTSAAGLHLAWLVFARRKEGHAARLLVLAALAFVFGLAWFFAVTHWVMPYFGDAGRGVLDSSAFSWLGSGLTEIVGSIVTRPDIVIAEILGNPQKLLYVLLIFGPFLFIPLLRPAPLIVAAPILSISLLSRDANYYSHAAHYTAGLIVPIIVAFHQGLPVARRIVEFVLRRLAPCHFLGTPQTSAATLLGVALATAILFWHWAYAPSPIGRLFWSDRVWAYSWRAYVPTERDGVIKAAINEHIPTDPAVSVSSQNTLNWGLLPNRDFYLPFPFGLDEPHLVPDLESKSIPGLLQFARSGEANPMPPVPVEADYAIIDRQRPYFLGDKGCGWIESSCTFPTLESGFLSAVETAYDKFEVVFEYDGFAILRRPTP